MFFILLGIVVFAGVMFLSIIFKWKSDVIILFTVIFLLFSICIGTFAPVAGFLPAVEKEVIEECGLEYEGKRLASVYWYESNEEYKIQKSILIEEVKIKEDASIEEPKLMIYEVEGKRTFWSYALYTEEEYILHVPKGALTSK